MMRQYSDSVGTDSIGSADIREYASVYSDDLEEESYAKYYAKFSDKGTGDRGGGTGDKGNEDYEDDDYENDEYSSEDREDVEDLSAADSFSSVDTPSVDESYIQEEEEESLDLKPLPTVQRKDDKSISKRRNSLKPQTPSRLRTPLTPPRLRTPEIPSIPSVATPSVLDYDDDSTMIYDGEDRMMETSDLGTVVDSVISSLMDGKGRSSKNRQAKYGRTREQVQHEEPPGEYDDVDEYHKNTEESSYDQFMDDFQNKSTDIVQKKSIGLTKLQNEGMGVSNKHTVGAAMPQVAEQQAKRTGWTPSRRNGTLLSAMPNINGVTLKKKTPNSPAQSKRPTAPSQSQRAKPPTAPTQSSSAKTHNAESVTSGFFSFRKTARSKSSVPTPMKQTGASSFEVQGSVDFSEDMSQPPVDLDGPVRVMNVAEVTEQALELRKKANLFLMRRQYNELIPFLQANPSLIKIQYQQSHSRNFIHVMAIQQAPVPENVLLKIISEDPSLVATSDNNGNTPLHYAALNAKKENMHVFLVMLKFHPLGVMQRNNEGDLPLHLAAANASRGSQMAVHMLLETNSRALSEPNKKGKIPLHLGLTLGSGNLKSLKTMMCVHKARKYSVVVKDNRGNTPLHTAIMSGTSYQAIELFNRVVRETELSAYTKENDQRYLPLHLALMMKKVNPLVVLSLIKAAPFTAGVPTPSGDMPIHLATKAELKPEIIKTLLAADMPIELGTKAGNLSMGTIVHREHGHSWWHVAVDKRSKYVDVVFSLLSDFATYIQIVALARSVGPDQKTVTIDAASAPLVDAFKNILRFYYRYEISTMKMPLCTDENQSFPAFDHGEDLERFKVTGPWLKSGFTKIRENSRQTAASERGREIMYIPWEPDQREITLRCYTFEEHFNAEKTIRDQKNMSSDYVENIVSIHSDSNYVNTSFTTGKIMCISFERNEGTLGEVMASNDKIRSQAGWLSNCQTVLKELATCLHHLHDKGVVHGRLDMDSFGQFGRKWKLLNVGNSTAMGNAMGGVLRKSAPPESLSGVQPILPSSAISAEKGRSRSKARANRASSSSVKGGSIGPSVSIGRKLPPLPAQGKSERKKFGVFIFGLKDLGLGNYGTKKSRKQGTPADDDSLGLHSMDSSLASVHEGNNTATDEASARVIAMQEDEISRLRRALEEKEHIYRRQLAEERATFKRQEADRQRELQKKLANQKATTPVPRYAPEKLMASASWDVWSFGLIMVEAIIGKSSLLPSSSDSDDDFLEHLSRFSDTDLVAICDEVGDIAGQFAVDLVARLLHPKPQQRITSMDKVLQHKYFHEEVIEPSNASRIRIKSKGSKLKNLSVTASKESLRSRQLRQSSNSRR